MTRSKLNFARSALARRVFVLFVLAALLPMAATAYLSYGKVSDVLHEQSKKQLHEAAKNYAQSLLGRLQLANQHTRQLVSTEDLADSGPFNDHIDRLVVAGKGLPVSNRTLVQVNQDRVILSLAHPAAPDKRILAQVNQDFIFGDPSKLPYATTICVYSDGKQLYCSDARVRDDLSNVDGREMRWEENNEEQLGIFWDLLIAGQFESEKWSIVAIQPVSTALSALGDFNAIFPPIIVLALALILLVSTVQIRRILTPLAALIDGTFNIAKRRFDQKVNVSSGDEFEYLADSMNGMASELDKQFRTLGTMAKLDRLILDSPDTTVISESILEGMHDVLGFEVACLTLFDPMSPSHANCFVSLPQADNVLAQRITLTQAELDFLQNTQTIQRIAVDSGYPLWRYFEALSSADETVVMPVIEKNRLVASLLVGWRKGTFNQNLSDRVEEFSSRLAVALAASEKEKELYKRAHIDSLTGLPNRQLFNDRLKQQMALAHSKKSEFALLFIDLDRFKNVNDSRGHDVGDELLCEAAKRISGCATEVDTVARLGGDEFVVVIADADHRRYTKVAQEIVAAMNLPFFIDGRDFYVGASVGIAVYPHDGCTPSEIVKNADTAMYRAKEGGRGRFVCFEDRMNQEIVRASQLERELRKALQRNEFRMFYQPKFCPRTRSIRGAEALIRWQHPREGLVLPSRFIPCAEDLGIVSEIGQWALFHACNDFLHWKQIDNTLTHIAVNVSPLQILDPAFVENVKSVLGMTGFPYGALELEITETMLVKDRETVIERLHELKQLGVQIVVDDFGTGYSAMNYLQWLPVDTLKIDKSFIKELTSDPKSHGIVRAIVAMAKTLEKGTVAEGIETEDQLELISQLGCDLVQGFLLSKPRTHKDILAMLQESKLMMVQSF